MKSCNDHKDEPGKDHHRHDDNEGEYRNNMTEMELRPNDNYASGIAD